MVNATSGLLPLPPSQFVNTGTKLSHAQPEDNVPEIEPDSVSSDVVTNVEKTFQFFWLSRDWIGLHVSQIPYNYVISCILGVGVL